LLWTVQKLRNLKHGFLKFRFADSAKRRAEKAEIREDRTPKK